MEQFAEYGHAIVSIAGVALFGLIINPISAAKKAASGAESGSLPAPDYNDPNYRWARAYLNLTEIMGLFVGACVAAMIAGASPFWVNILASVFFVSRLVMAFVHIQGFGKPNSGMRTIIFAIGWAVSIVLAVMAIFAVLA